MLTILPIPALQDNYIWCLTTPPQRACVIVDPGIAQPVFDFLSQHTLELQGILITHHHWDHYAGVNELIQQFKVPIWAPADSRITAVTHTVHESTPVDLPQLDCTFQVLEIPGHTRSHVAYYGDGKIFCGDTLFTAGCGRIFEGTPAQMLAALQKIAALPPATLIYCGHEYTLANLKFALAVEPDNLAMQKRLAAVEQQRQQGMPTVPSTLAEEQATNPFLRTHLPNVQTSIAQHVGEKLSDPVAYFAALREWKNHF